MSVTLASNLTPGTYYLGGIADYTNQYSETNETNNTYNVVQIIVGTGPQPDFSEYIVPKNTTVNAGGALNFDAYTENFGTVAAPASSSAYYLSTDATITTSDTLLATTSSGALSIVSTAGYYQYHDMSVTLASNLAPGTYYLGGIADYTNQYSETNETNNTYNVVQITVGPASDPFSEVAQPHHDWWLV